MRILYDGQIYVNQTAGGINRYFANLISKLPDYVFPTLTTLQDRSINYPNHPNLTSLVYKQFRPKRISSFLKKSYFQAIATFKHFDLIHPTYYSLLTEQDFSCLHLPLVLTVHDMIYEIFYPCDSHVEEKRKAILAAQAIICVSENTKNDLLERYPLLSESKVKVIYLASEIDIRSSYGLEQIPSQPYYLYVGSRATYKNFSGLLLALAKAVSVRPDIVLCVVGPPFNQEEEKLITELKLTTHLEYYGYVSDSQLAKLYHFSIALVYPSLYEGFGIPPLEAMSCGTVVVASDCSSIPEVVGNAGLLFNPKIVDDLADILLLLLDSPIKRDYLVAKGHQRAQMFSWDKTVAQTLDVYRSVCNLDHFQMPLVSHDREVSSIGVVDSAIH